jgi:hypothetical protein
VNGQIEGRIYTKFCSIKPNNEFGDFHQHFDQSKVAKEWMGGDLEALEDGERQCREATQHWMSWIRAQTCEVPAAVRFDYFIGRTPVKGKAQIWTLEICELGFSMLGEPDLPKKVFQAMLNSCMVFSGTQPVTPAPATSKAPEVAPVMNTKGGQSLKGKGAGKNTNEGKIPPEAPETLYAGIPPLPSLTEDQKKCHGEYSVMPDQAGGKPTWFAFLDGNERWLYQSDDGYWYIGDHEERAKNFKCDEGYIRGKGSCWPHEVNDWEYFDDRTNKWKKHSDIKVSPDEETLEAASKASGGQGAGKSGQRQSRNGKKR